MAKIKFKWNMAGFEAVRRLPGVAEDINRRAEAIATAAGDGYEASPYDGKTRHRASIFARTKRAQRDNAKNNTLVKSVDHGR